MLWKQHSHNWSWLVCLSISGLQSVFKCTLCLRKSQAFPAASQKTYPRILTHCSTRAALPSGVSYINNIRISHFEVQFWQRITDNPSARLFKSVLQFFKQYPKGYLYIYIYIIIYIYIYVFYILFILFFIKTYFFILFTSCLYKKKFLLNSE